MEASGSLSLQRERNQTVLLNIQGARASFPSFTARPQLGRGKAIYTQVTSVWQILQAQKEAGDEVLYLGGSPTFPKTGAVKGSWSAKSQPTVGCAVLLKDASWKTWVITFWFLIFCKGCLYLQASSMWFSSGKRGTAKFRKEVFWSLGRSLSEWSSQPRFLWMILVNLVNLDFS